MADVELSLTWPGIQSAGNVDVGDTMTVWAGATTEPLSWPSCVLYVSRPTESFDWPVRPERFSFTSSNPDVASIDEKGFLVALSAGETLLTAASAGVTSLGLLLTVRSPADDAALGVPANTRLVLAERYRSKEHHVCPPGRLDARPG